MQTPLERAKSRTLKDIKGILRISYRHRGDDPRSVFMPSWMWSRISKSDPGFKDEAIELYTWGVRNPDELEVYIAGRSPVTVAEWATRRGRRLCPEAENIIRGKAGDRSTLLDYFIHFGILLGDISKVTMKAAFDDKSHREKAYIRKIQHTKSKIKEFIGQMVSNGDLDPETTVEELMEKL